MDTAALIERLKAGALGAVDVDVYEIEKGVIFEDLADIPLQDDMLARLIGFPNVLITSHQGCLTRKALDNIVNTTPENCRRMKVGAGDTAVPLSTFEGSDRMHAATAATSP